MILHVIITTSFTRHYCIRHTEMTTYVTEQFRKRTSDVMLLQVLFPPGKFHYRVYILTL